MPVSCQNPSRASQNVAIGCRFRQFLALMVGVHLLAGCTSPSPQQISGLPDLVPVHTAPKYCLLDLTDPNHKFLIVRVNNQGSAFDPGSLIVVTKVTFASRDGFPGAVVVKDVPGYPWPMGGIYEHLVEIPANAFVSDLLNFTITVDATNVIDESNEANNTVNGLCFLTGIIIRPPTE